MCLTTMVFISGKAAPTPIVFPDQEDGVELTFRGADAAAHAQGGVHHGGAAAQAARRLLPDLFFGEGTRRSRKEFFDFVPSMRPVVCLGTRRTLPG